MHLFPVSSKSVIWKVLLHQLKFLLPDAEPQSEKDVECSAVPNPSISSPFAENIQADEYVEIVDDNDDGCDMGNRGNASKQEFRTGLDIDINLPHQIDMDEEIADVDVSDDDADKGPNAAEALRAQVNAECQKKQTSSSSSSSDSESSETESGSGSGTGSVSASTSTDSESSEADSVNSIWDILVMQAIQQLHSVGVADSGEVVECYSTDAYL